MGSGMLAIAMDDFVVNVIDIAQRQRIVRRFRGHNNRITSMVSHSGAESFKEERMVIDATNVKCSCTLLCV